MMPKPTPFRRHLAALAATGLLASACNGEIYVRDGVTDGDTFYLAERALIDSDPVLQSWVSYSLTRSVCQLELGGDNPARASSFDCELMARRHLLETWHERQAKNPDIKDTYLDELSAVQKEGYLPEYVAEHFRRRHWSLPSDLRRRAYREWRREHLNHHAPATHLAGSWNYARNVRAQAGNR
jgi:hypothetical protein